MAGRGFAVLLVALSFALTSVAAAQDGAEPQQAEWPPNSKADKKRSKKGEKAGKKAGKKKKGKKKKGKKSNLPEIHARVGRTWMFLMPVDLDLAAGYQDGYRTLEDQSGPLAETSARLVPTLRWRRGVFLVEAPLEVGHRQPLGHDVQWTRSDGDLVLSGKITPHLCVEGAAGGVWTAMPSIPDPYQPIVDVGGNPTGELGATDRYGYWAVRARGEVGYNLDPGGSGPELVLGTDLDRRVYEQDPNFDPILRPNHLVPGDRDKIAGEVSIRGQLKGWDLRYRFDARVASIDYNYALARDSGTGLTHGSPGGEAPNPTASFLQTTLRARNSVWLRGLWTRLLLDVDFTINDDRFEGYYSWMGVRAQPGFRARLAKGLKLEASVAFERRQYTKDGYQEGPPGHPVLDDGDSLRQTTRVSGKGKLSYTPQSQKWLTPWIDFRAARVETNFPDYVPGVFPVGAPYDIDFDTSELTARAGISMSF